MSRVTVAGQLEIDINEGVVTFRAHNGVIILRVTHLRHPIPIDTLIDLASVAALTSYTPLEGIQREQKL